MTPKTLTKERREKFDDIIMQWLSVSPAIVDVTGNAELLCEEVGRLAGILAEASVSRSEIRGIEAAIFAGRPVTEEDMPIGDEALKAFERDLQCPGSWSWYPAKSSDESAWKSLREFVVKLYQSDQKAFEKYYTWARDPFARGAKLPIHIRQDPTCFEYAWQAYQAANPGQVNSTSQTTKDDNGIPETY